MPPVITLHRSQMLEDARTYWRMAKDCGDHAAQQVWAEALDHLLDQKTEGAR